MGRGTKGVRPASASSIELTFFYKGVRCRERIQLEPTPANLARVAKHKAAIEHAIDIGAFDYAATFPNSKNVSKFKSPINRTPLDRYLEQWLERKRPYLKSSTFVGYRAIVRGPLLTLFGDIPLGDITRRLVREKLQPLSVSNKRLRNIQSCLRSALDEAIDEELLESNPLTGWAYSNRGEEIKRTSTEAVVDPFSAEEQQAILATMRPEISNYYMFAFWTGLRTSELIALEWGDIDWVEGQVHVERALTQGAESAEAPKTLSSRRQVKLLRPALAALRRQKAHTFMANKQVFLDPRYGTPFTGHLALRKYFWIPALRKAGVRYRVQYQTRHTYASMMLSAGEHPMWVAKQMGHSDWSMITRVYGKWMPSDYSNEGTKAEKLFYMQDTGQDANANITPTSTRKPAK